MARSGNPATPQMLIAAATAVFADKGLAEAKVHDITELAGVSKGSFYLHFASKEALFEQICRAFIDDVVSHMEGYGAVMCAGADVGPDLIHRLAKADEGLLDLMWERRQHLSMVLHGAMATQASTLTDEFVDAIERTMRATIVDAHAVLPFQAPMSPDFLAAMAAGLLLMFARRLVRSGERPQISRDVHHFRRILMIGGVLTSDQLDHMLAEFGAHISRSSSTPIADACTSPSERRSLQ